jgi:predicted nucleic acid-binding protein
MGTTTNSHFLIADSSGLISLVSVSDENHETARTAFADLKETPCTIIIPGDIFTETVNTLNKRATHALAVDAIAYLMGTPSFVVTETPSPIRRDALRRFTEHGSASISLTDFIVMAAADAYGTKLIFGFDEGFERSGYTILAQKEVREAA